MSELKREAADIKDMVKKVVFVFEPKIRDKGLILKLELPRDPIMAYADKNRINQVLNTLVENAIRFTDKGSIGISVNDIETGVKITVSDTGAVIPPEHINKAFEIAKSPETTMLKLAWAPGLRVRFEG